MFDLTKEIQLDDKEHSHYQKFQFALYIFALLGLIYFTFLILFPTQLLIFSFLNPNASSNTLTRPRASDGQLIMNGKIGMNSGLKFDASLLGNYSRAVVNLNFSRKSEIPNLQTLSIVKSYQSFLYPDAPPIGFKDGSLLKNNGTYYIVSNNNLHEFQSISVVNYFNYHPEAFMDVANEELDFNSPGTIIRSGDGYPEDSLFKINDEYYVLKAKALTKFISPQAYFSQYHANQAVEKDEGFLNSYETTNDQIGFSDGSLVSYGESVYIISENKILPIDSTFTFAAAGYDWKDVVSVGADEVSHYLKTRIFTLRDPHPNGTIFLTTDDSKYYMIRNGLKNSLPSKNIAQSWFTKQPILASQGGAATSVNCQNIKRSLLSSRSYSCEVDLNDLINFIGKDYELSALFYNNVELDTMDISFKKTFAIDTLRTSLRDILTRIRNNYAK